MDDKTKDILTEWAINFIKSKNVFANNLVNIDKNKEGFDIKAVYSDKEEYAVIEPFVEDADKLIQKISKEKNVLVFLFNSYENFKFLVDNWKRLIDFPKLTVYFVNMFSNTDKKWAIRPYTHNLISDNSSLKEGLNSMFMGVELLTEESIQKVYKD